MDFEDWLGFEVCCIQFIASRPVSLLVTRCCVYLPGCLVSIGLL
jgi:hypothetical protein